MSRRASANGRKCKGRRGENTAVVQAPPLEATENGTESSSGIVRDGFILDFISGAKEVKDSPKEQVRQCIARALFHEYAISVEDMEADFPVQVAGRRRQVDIAIFGSGESHEFDNIPA